ncbi:DUF397 domain-containing protein [Streptomyces bambusae]|uniref:DUF397 domain-containing protein n=1 Tax=Streptomyces bambusae TaxID=1550616 RepID=UPI001CFFE113|nr:DUF397 domain-containing protein [Streptomyces bambusae]MCB5170013.1 DUF397 domain-containing protein [Streptomyces bambusae]
MPENTVTQNLGRPLAGWGKPALDLSHAQWASGSRGAGDLQIAFVEGFIALRAGERPGHPPLILAPDEWRAFVLGTRGGRFGPA